MSGSSRPAAMLISAVDFRRAALRASLVLCVAATVAVAAIPNPEKIADAVRKIISNTQSLAGKNEVAFPYTTIALHCSKVSHRQSIR